LYHSLASEAQSSQQELLCLREERVKLQEKNQLLAEKVEDQLIALTIFEDADVSSERREERLAHELGNTLHVIEENLGNYSFAVFYLYV
jgi:hypothetical protein